MQFRKRIEEENTEEIILFNGDNTGQHRSVTLSDNITNYRFIEILYKDSDGFFNSVKVEINGNNGKNISLSTNAVFEDVIYKKEGQATVNGNTINIVNENAYYINSNGITWQGNSTSISITTVIAYK